MNSYTEAVQKAMKGDQEAYTYLYEKNVYEMFLPGEEVFKQRAHSSGYRSGCLCECF